MVFIKFLIALGLIDMVVYFFRRVWGRFFGSKFKFDWFMFREDINCLKKNIFIYVYYFIFKNKLNKILLNCDNNFLNFIYISLVFLFFIFLYIFFMSLVFFLLKLILRNF